MYPCGTVSQTYLNGAYFYCSISHRTQFGEKGNNVNNVNFQTHWAAKEKRFKTVKYTDSPKIRTHGFAALSHSFIVNTTILKKLSGL